MANGIAGLTLSSGLRIAGQPIRGSGGRVFAIEQPVRTGTPLIGAVPKAARANGQPAVVFVGGGGGCGGANATAASIPGTAENMARGGAKRPEYGPVVAVTTQTMPRGFTVGPLAFGTVIPEGR